MMKKMKEGVEAIYKEKKLIAIIKRDDETKKHIVYLVNEATSEDIADLLADNGFDIESHIIQKKETK